MSLVLPGCADVDSDLPRPYRRIALPQARLESEAARSRGRALFLSHCALCHGDHGDGQGIRREGLSESPRDFTNRTWRESTSPRHVFFAIREGIQGTPMPGWKSLTVDDAWDLTAQVLSLGEQ